MKTQGEFTPETATAARSQYEALELAAETVTKEVAKAGTDSREAYQELTTPEIIDTAQETLFASLLEVTVGTAAEFEAWLEDHPGLTVSLAGHESVSQRAWHPIPPRDVVAAVSFEDGTEAAVATVRRQAVGKHYRSLLGLQ